MDALVEEICRGPVPFERIVESWAYTGFDLLAELSQTEQDPEWHAEGDVGVHTGMVLEEAYRELDDEASSLDESRRRILLLGAVFHDIAKPLTTVRREFDGQERVIAPRHAERGRSWLACRLQTLGLPDEELAAVLGLVGYHHHPRQLVLKDQPEHAWRRVAGEADMQLLYHLERADVRGRRCHDTDEQLEVLELFRMECETLGLWHGAHPWQSWLDAMADELGALEGEPRRRAECLLLSEGNRGTSLAPWNAWARTHTVRESKKRFTLLVGPAGSGKSTWWEANAEDATVVSLDEIRRELLGDSSNQKHSGQVSQLAKERLKAALREDGDIIWDATSLREDRRRPLLSLAEQYGAYTRIVAFQTPVDELRRRNRTRDKPVKGEVLERQIDRLQWPTRVEAHELQLA